ERIVRVLAAPADIADGGKSESWIVDLSGQGGCFPLSQIVLRDDRISCGVYQHDLLALYLIRRHLDRISEAVGQREGWTHAPGVAEIDVVERNDALIERLCPQRLQS